MLQVTRLRRFLFYRFYTVRNLSRHIFHILALATLVGKTLWQPLASHCDAAFSVLGCCCPAFLASSLANTVAKMASCELQKGCLARYNPLRENT